MRHLILTIAIATLFLSDEVFFGWVIHLTDMKDGFFHLSLHPRFRKTHRD